MNDELGIGHRFLDRMAGDRHELRKLDLPTLKKAALLAGDKQLAAQLDGAVLDHDGSVNLVATAIKLARAAALKKAGISPQWANPGSVEAAPRGSGPAPTPPSNRANAGTEVLTPVMTSAGTVFAGGNHNPEFALRLIQALVDQARRAQRR